MKPAVQITRNYIMIENQIVNRPQSISPKQWEEFWEKLDDKGYKQGYEDGLTRGEEGMQHSRDNAYEDGYSEGYRVATEELESNN